MDLVICEATENQVRALSLVAPRLAFTRKAYKGFFFEKRAYSFVLYGGIPGGAGG